MLESRIQQQFFDSADLAVQVAENLARPIAQATEMLVGCVTAGGKILLAGLGPAMADAQRYAAYLCGCFERQRPALPSLVLASDAATLSSLTLAGSSFEPLKSGVMLGLVRQMQALAMPGDVLVLLCGCDDLAAWQPLIHAAHEKELSLIVFAAGYSEATSHALQEKDVLITVPSRRLSRIYEVHQLAWHCLCDAIDHQLLGEEDL